MYLLEHHIDQETKQAAKEFQEYFDLITMTSEHRMYREVNNIICTLRENYRILDPTNWELNQTDILSSIQYHFCQINLNLAENINIKLLLHEYPLSKELISIIQQDLRDNYYPALCSCINAIKAVLNPFDFASSHNFLYHFIMKLVHRASKSNYFKKMADIFIPDICNLIDFSSDNLDPSLIDKLFQVMHHYLESTYHEASIWGVHTRFKQGIGPKDIYTRSDTKPKTEEKDTKKTSDNKSTDYLEYFRTHIADALTSAILYRIKE